MNFVEASELNLVSELVCVDRDVWVVPRAAPCSRETLGWGSGEGWGSRTGHIGGP